MIWLEHNYVRVTLSTTNEKVNYTIIQSFPQYNLGMWWEFKYFWRVFLCLNHPQYKQHLFEQVNFQAHQR